MRVFMTFSIAGVALACASAGIAGTFTPVGESGGSYSFSQCERPAKPDLAIDPALKGNARTLARNEAVKKFNAYVVEANAYLECTAAEAERDMLTYQNAVTATLEAEQDAVISGVEELRDGFRR